FSSLCAPPGTQPHRRAAMRGCRTNPSSTSSRTSQSSARSFSRRSRFLQYLSSASGCLTWSVPTAAGDIRLFPPSTSSSSAWWRPRCSSTRRPRRWWASHSSQLGQWSTRSLDVDRADRETLILLRQPDDDLAEVRPAFEMCQCVACLLEWEYPVDD